jgi:hypothetical protein
MPDSSQRYLEIMHHYDACLQRHGDTARGADWPNEADRRTRFSVMLDLLEGARRWRLNLGDKPTSLGNGGAPRYSGQRLRATL